MYARIREVPGAVRGRVQQRRRLHPVLVRRVDLHAERAGIGPLAAPVSAVGLVGDRIVRHDVREREPPFDIEMVLAVALGAAGLREAIVHVDAVARRDPLHVAVERLLAVLGFVEPEMPEVVEKAPGLRRDLGVDALDVPGQRIGVAEVVACPVTQEFHPVAHGGEAQAVHLGVLGGVRELVDVVRSEIPAGEADGRSVRVVVPAGCGNDLRRVVEMNAMRQRRLGLVQRRRRVAQRERRCPCRLPTTMYS